MALDVWYLERQQDAAGEYYRRVVFQRDGMVPGRTTQGFYLFEADGTLFRGFNHRDPERVRRALEDCLAARAQRPETSAAASTTEPSVLDPRYERTLPAGARIARVSMRVLDAEHLADGGEDPLPESFRETFRHATGRDHLWILADELEALGAGRFPERLLRRIARFHLVDATRGEPPFWTAAEVLRLSLEPSAEDPHAFDGRFALAHRGEEPRSFEGVLHADVEVAEGELRRFDLVAVGEAEGHGTWTAIDAPAGPFRFAVALRLLPEGSNVPPPQAARDLGDYLRAD